MTPPPRSSLKRYGFALLFVALAAALTWLVPLINQRTPFALFFLAISLSTLYGGRGAGLFATLLSGMISVVFFIPPIYSPEIGLAGAFQLGVFLFVALIVGSLVENIRSAEATTRASELRLAITLRSIGDAVLVTDKEGHITFLNPVAQKLTGWDMADARGREIKEIFHIINEGTRAEVESPVTRVLREGIVVGLANHTVLIAKDGSEIPIDDSGAPLRDDEGNVVGAVLVFRDITERRQAEEARLRLAAIVENSYDAIIGKTLEGIITSWNKGAEQLYGYSADEVVGRPINMLALPERQDEIARILERLKRGEKIEQLETLRITKDGRVLNVSLTISPIKNSKGEVTGASTIARDITERKRLEEEHAELLTREHAARIEAENANRMKDEFLATLSHELRTPLTAMLGWTSMLRSKRLDEKTAEHALETIERNAKVQARLVEDLLDVSRIITGNLRLDARPVELVPVVEAALDAVRPAAEAKSIKLKTNLDPFAGPVSGDPARLQQIVWNLLSNAVKFTTRGGHVLAQLERNGSHVEIKVSDTGPGITPEFLPHVFDRFRQADSSTTRAHGGLGLGLAIVRHLVELHGGSVSAASDGEGRGATFTVRLPLASILRKPTESVGAQSLQPALSNAASSLAGLRVLVVEDEDDTRELLRKLLAQHEAEVEVAANADEALRVLKQVKPDILVSDIGMPDADGYELIRGVRSLGSKLGVIPAIALTAYAGEEDRQRALSEGYQLHLPKPIDPQELVEAIASLAGQVK